jgi:hypothetical protein
VQRGDRARLPASMSGFLFARPPLSSVAAFAGGERVREKQEREERARRMAERERKEREEQQHKMHAQLREDTLVEVELLATEVLKLVQSLLCAEESLTKSEHVEIIAGAICEGATPLAAQLRTFWGNESDAVAACVQQVHNHEEGQDELRLEDLEIVKNTSNSTNSGAEREGGASLIRDDSLGRIVQDDGALSKSRAQNREQAFLMKSESTKSRAHKTDLLMRLKIRKTLSASLEDGGRRGWRSGCVSKESACVQEEKGAKGAIDVGSQLGMVLKACKVDALFSLSISLPPPPPPSLACSPTLSLSPLFLFIFLSPSLPLALFQFFSCFQNSHSIPTSDHRRLLHCLSCSISLR